jgi:hypothetical protein
MRRNERQADLFEAYTRARPSDPDTSHVAAERIQQRLNKLQFKVLDHFRAIAPQSITDLDLEYHFNNHGSTYRTRRAELTELGLIQDTGLRRWQEGSHRVLWAATPWSS